MFVETILCWFKKFLICTNSCKARFYLIKLILFYRFRVFPVSNTALSLISQAEAIKLEMPVECICGKTFGSEAGRATHIRRQRCRGPPERQVEMNKCGLCERPPFNTHAGLRQHQRQAHADWYYADLEHQAENPVRTATAWLDEEVIGMARLEMAYEGHFINRYLATQIPNRTRDAIQSKRLTAGYTELLASLRGEAARDVEDEVLEQAEAERAGEALVELVEEETIEVPPINHPLIRADGDENRDRLRNFLNVYFVTKDEWNDDDRHLHQTVSQNTVQNGKASVLETLEAWLDRQMPSKAKTKGRRHAPPRPRPQTNRPYRASQNRAFHYKQCQELYKNDRRRLARHLLDNEPLNTSNDVPPIETIREHYTNIFGAESPADDAPFSIKGNPQQTRPIEEADVKAAIQTLKESAPGLDNWTAKDLRNVAPERLVLLFNVMLLYSIVPDRFKQNRTILIPKGNETADVNKWRPITIASAIIRLLNKILANRIASLDFHPHQRGFRKIDGVLLNNLTLESIIKDKRANIKPYALIALDLSKAFDTVSHKSIFRAIKRMGVDKVSINLIEEQYQNSRTKIQFRGQEIPEIMITRGVKQGDPLSPILFNAVLDELFESLERRRTGGLTTSTGLNIKAVGYADDIIIMDNTVSGAQKSLNVANTFFNKRGLSINPEKSVAASVAVLPGRKILYPQTTGKFVVNGARITQLKATELFKYLGQRYGVSGGEGNVFKIDELLTSLAKSPLKPYQKLEMVRLYLIPRLLHKLQTTCVTKKDLNNTDMALRVFIRKTLHLNKTTSNGFLHAPIREGGLGIISMMAYVPVVLRNRIQSLLLEGEESIHLVLNTDHMIKLRSKLERWTGTVGTTRAIHAHFSDMLEEGYSGGGLRQGSCSAASGSWIRFPPPFWSGKEYVQAIQLRANMLPTKGVPSNPRHERLCRGCNNKSETLCHVLQGCPISHWNRIKRHDRIANRLKTMAEATGWNVVEEPYLVDRNRLVLKPDLLFIKDRKVVVCDVTIAWEGRQQSLSAAYNSKRAKYSTAEFLECVRKKYPDKEVKTTALAIGARGIWCRENEEIINELGLARRHVEQLISNTINGSILIHSDFMRTVWRRRENPPGGRPRVGG